MIVYQIPFVEISDATEDTGIFRVKVFNNSETPITITKVLVTNGKVLSSPTFPRIIRPDYCEVQELSIKSYNGKPKLFFVINNQNRAVL